MVMIPDYQRQQGLDVAPAPNIRLDTSIGDEMQRLGNAVMNAGEQFQQHQSQLERYKTNLAVEQGLNELDKGEFEDLENGAADGSDIVPNATKRMDALFSKTLAGVKDEETRLKLETIFTRERGTRELRAMKNATEKGRNYVVGSTMQSLDDTFAAGKLKTADEFNAKFDTEIMPRLQSVIKDPLELQKWGATLRKKMRDEYFKVNPDAAVPAKTAEGGDYYARLRQVESGGNDNARNASGAAGRYQFMPSTAKAYGITDVMDVGQQETAVRKLTADNRASLRKALKREPTPGELYLAHQQGAGGAARLLANPLEPAVRIVGKQAVLQNGGNEGMSAQDFANMWISKFEGTAAPSTGYAMPDMPKGGIFTDMDPDEWNSRVNAGRTVLKESLDLGIEQQNVDREDILRAPIDDGDKAMLLRRFDERNKDAVQLGGFLDAMQSGAYVDPRDEGNRKAAGLAFNAAGGGAALVNGDTKATGAMFDIYRKTSIVPAPAKGAIEGMLRSNNPARINTALSYLDALDRENHRAFLQEFPEETNTLLQEFRAGLDYSTPDETAKRVTESLSPETATIRKEREKEADKVAKDMTLDEVKNLFDPSILPFNEPDLSLSPEAESEIMQDYKNQYVQAFRLTGDDAKARKAAADNLTKVWGMSSANRGRVMKWPPEALYGPSAMVDGSFDWMAEDVMKALMDKGYTREIPGKGVGRGGTGGLKVKAALPHYLVADARTKAEAAMGKPASYLVFVQDEDGNFDLVPERFAFDPKPYRDRAREKFRKDQGANVETRKRLDAAIAAPPQAEQPDALSIPGLGAPGGNALDSPFNPQ